MTLDDFLIDKRIVRRNIEKGRLDAATYQRLLDELPDSSGKLWRPEPSHAAEPARAPTMPPAAPSAAPPAAEERPAEPSVVPPSPSAPG